MRQREPTGSEGEVERKQLAGQRSPRKSGNSWQTHLKLSLFLQRFHLGLVVEGGVALGHALPLHLLSDHHRLPIGKAAGGEHVRPHAVSKVHHLQGEEVKTTLKADVYHGPPSDLHRTSS